MDNCVQKIYRYCVFLTWYKLIWPKHHAKDRKKHKLDYKSLYYQNHNMAKSCNKIPEAAISDKGQVCAKKKAL